MTATTVASAVWLDLVAGDLHAMQGLDRVMEADGCERTAALAVLHGAATDWLKSHHRELIGDPDTKRPNSDLPVTYTGTACHYFSTGDFEQAESEVEWISRDPAGSVSWYVKWVVHFDRAIAILRELQAIPGGE